MSLSRAVVITLIVATVGAVTLAPEIADRHPVVWLFVTGLASATVIAVVISVMRHHRAIRDVWSNR